MSLSNKTFLITRTRKQAIPLIEMLEQYGCNVLNVPTIKITDPEDPQYLKNVLKNLSAFEWIVFTSANAVRYFFKFKSNDDKDLQQVKIACVGKKTGEVLNSFNFIPQLIPEIFSNQGLLTEIKKNNIRGKHILLPVSNATNDQLQLGLKSLGAHVKRIEVYSNTPYRDSQWDTIYEMIMQNLIDCITFYSPSALNAFVQMMGKEGIDIINKNKIPIAVIGTSTAQAVREAKLKLEIMPTISDDEHLVKALDEYFGEME